MTYEEIVQGITNRRLANIYLFYGAEPFYIDRLTHFCEHHLMEEGARAFNQTLVYGKEIDAQAVRDELAQFPMMSEHRVVIIKEAQDMRSFGDLLPLVENPPPHGILVLAYKAAKIDKRTKLGKTLLDKAVVFESKALYDNQVPAWIRQYGSENGIKIDLESANLLAEYLGSDLQKISNEVDKLKLNAGEGGTVTSEDVREQIGVSKDYNIFELQKALGQKDAVKAARIVNYFADNPKSNPIQMSISSLFSYFMKVFMTAQNGSKSDNELAKLLGMGSPYFIKEYREAARRYSPAKLKNIVYELREADLQSKGFENRSIDDGELFKALVYKILH